MSFGQNQSSDANSVAVLQKLFKIDEKLVPKLVKFDEEIRI